MAASPIRNHLLVTVDESVRGLVVPCVGRLTDHLRTTGRQFLVVEDAALSSFAAGGAALEFPSAMIAVGRILWAHEYAALQGDEHQRRHYVPEDEQAARIVMSSPSGLVIEGYVTRAWLAQPSRFGVVREPRPLGFTPLAERHAAEMRGLGYVVVHRDAVATVSFPDGAAA